MLHDNISKTSYDALELIEQTLAARGFPSIEQSYQQLLKTLPDDEAKNIEKVGNVSVKVCALTEF